MHSPLLPLGPSALGGFRCLAQVHGERWGRGLMGELDILGTFVGPSRKLKLRTHLGMIGNIRHQAPAAVTTRCTGTWAFLPPGSCWDLVQRLMINMSLTGRLPEVWHMYCREQRLMRKSWTAALCTHISMPEHCDHSTWNVYFNA